MITITDGNFDRLWEIYTSSFPLDEQRSQKDILQLISHGQLQFKGIEIDNNIVGLIAFRVLDKFVYIEYLAIAEEARGNGFGKKIMSYFTQMYKHYCIILEVEAPSNELQKKRISFYEQCDFHYNATHFVQPPLQKNGREVDMRLMSWPIKIEDTGFDMVKETLLNSVYNLVAE
ncbi:MULTISPECIES: GNAT family N-acetyltransferase [Flammeovirga]|uniref:GNAT family N-acetyltransferase n=1 Tax=Flammeovirga agarivorans TaxID=2726742 RepID=A0A7X8SPS6_9BACT|nr:MULTISPECIES: GNAT family N-acetyltransferase [Flammeovirga]NLR94151.1 GNAT family N-acetyltransferase [Flammeovirga agarivorans]